MKQKLPIGTSITKRTVVLTVLFFGLCTSIILSSGIGAVSIEPLQIISIILAKCGLAPMAEFDPQQAAVFEAIRLPRVVLGLLAGASLSMAGATMQGLYRNPLADPGLLGISSGASLMAAASIVLGIHWFGHYTLPIFAFVGSLGAIATIYFLAHKDGNARMGTLLLAGIAISSLCMAITGYFTFISTDEQLRSITFWQLGSLGGATWASLMASAPFMVFSLLVIPLFGKSLNALMLGESNARYLGVNVERIKFILIVLVALSVGASVAVSGMIGFIGLVVPHVVRLTCGPDNKLLLPASGLLGSTLLILADLFARTSVSPSELPIGVVTALIGSPFFLYLILRDRQGARL